MPESCCRFEYLYRDAGNYKAFGHVLLLGIASPDNEASIRAALIEGLWFVAEAAGIPTLYHLVRDGGEADPALDHVWHEFVGLRHAEVRDAEAAIKIEVMIMKLRGVT
ncbi:MAG: hypothetical protein ABJC19_03720 [Gemmatimonadota bacterium]